MTPTKDNDCKVPLHPAHSFTHTAESHWADPSPLTILPYHWAGTTESESTDGRD